MIIQLNSVSRLYQLGSVEVEALKDVTLDVPEGEFIVILGASGSGKTTLLNLVGGMDSPTSGRIRVHGLEISSLKSCELTRYRRDCIGFVFQFFNLIPSLTARENVEFAAELVNHHKDPLEMLDLVGLAARADHFPGELSGGEQQRVAIARALVKDPQILLCDEPIGELDFETGKSILSAIKRVNQAGGKTVLLVTHNNAIADIAHRVVRLRSGEVTEDRPNPSPVDPKKLTW